MTIVMRTEYTDRGRGTIQYAGFTFEGAWRMRAEQEWSEGPAQIVNAVWDLEFDPLAEQSGNALHRLSQIAGHTLTIGGRTYEPVYLHHWAINNAPWGIRGLMLAMWPVDGQSN